MHTRTPFGAFTGAYTHEFFYLYTHTHLHTTTGHQKCRIFITNEPHGRRQNFGVAYLLSLRARRNGAHKANSPSSMSYSTWTITTKIPPPPPSFALAIAAHYPPFHQCKSKNALARQECAMSPHEMTPSRDSRASLASWLPRRTFKLHVLCITPATGSAAKRTRGLRVRVYVVAKPGGFSWARI